MNLHIKKIALFVLGLIIIGLAYLFLQEEYSKTCFKDKCFLLQVAKTEKQREKGLSGRKKLDPNKGMIFVFDGSGKYVFWMKDTLIPLDIIWLDENFKVVDLREQIQPCNNNDCSTFTPIHEAKYVMELNACQAKNIDLKVGDQVKYKKGLW